MYRVNGEKLRGDERDKRVGSVYIEGVEGLQFQKKMSR